MRADVILIVLSLVLLTTGILCVCALRATALELMDAAQSAADALPLDAAQAQALLSRLSERWGRVERRWQFLAIHDDLSQVSESLDEARVALALGDVVSARIALTRTVAALDAILHKELPTPGNIF